MASVNTPSFLVAHTDDDPDFGPLLNRYLEPLGVGIHSYATNEAAWEDVHRGTAQYSGYIVDYDTVGYDPEGKRTRSDAMSGSELLAKIAAAKIGGEVLILLSSRPRSDLQKAVTASMEKRGLPADRAQIFDKFNEQPLAMLYVGLRLHFPDETAALTRKDIIGWLGYETDSEGNVQNRHRMYAESSDRLSKLQDRAAFAGVLGEIYPQRSPKEGNSSTPGGKERL